MSPVKPSGSAVRIKRLTTEIRRLSDQQAEAMRKAALVGMTAGEVRKYKERGVKIADLMNQMATITRKRAL